MLLYHYTSIDTLCSIVNRMLDGNMFLRASNAKNMNDPNDCYYFVDIAGQILNKDRTTIDNYFQEKNKYETPYLICFSKLKDDLHMWNCYGVDGKGVAIGFDKTKLNGATQKFYSENHLTTRLHLCLYKSRQQIRNSISFAKLINNNTEESFWQNKNISDFANLVKHPCYKYEKEWRIVIKHGVNEPIIKDDVYNSYEDAFYLAVPIDAVKYIVVGPNAKYDAIKKIFSSYFPNAKIIKSIIPYRSR